MLSQRRAIRETDMYGKSADKFLSLIPECCHLNTVHSAEREEDCAFRGKGKNSHNYWNGTLNNTFYTGTKQRVY